MEMIPDHAVARELSWDDLVPALQRAFASSVNVPARLHESTSSGTLLVMPAWTQGGFLGLKVATVHPDNPEIGLPSVHATYVLLNERTGERVCVLEGRALTTRRTAAASALASCLLSRAESRTLLMVGAGAVATQLVDAHLWARPDLDRVLIWNRTAERARNLVDYFRRQARARSVTFDVSTSLSTAAQEADIISCATLSKTPLLRGEWVRQGTHVDLVGAFRPDMRESDAALLNHARIFVDALPDALAEAGDLRMAIDEGVLSPHAVEGDLFALCLERSPPNRLPTDITVFKSVGHALEDLVAAQLVAQKLGLLD